MANSPRIREFDNFSKSNLLLLTAGLSDMPSHCAMKAHHTVADQHTWQWI